MARRRKDAGSGLGVVLVLLVLAAAIAGPFVLAGWALFSEFRARNYRGASRASQLIEPSERLEIGRLEAELGRIEAEMNRLDVEGDRQGFERRADGGFDARRPAARELNRRIEGLAAQRSQLLYELESARAPLARRMDAWLRARSGVVASRAGLLVYVGVFVWMTVWQAGEAGQSVTFAGLMFGEGLDGGSRVLASAVATLAAGITLWIAGSSARASLAA